MTDTIPAPPPSVEPLSGVRAIDVARNPAAVLRSAQRREVVYVAGPYSADTPEGVEANVRRAVDVATKLRRLGYVCVVPHLLSAGCEDTLTEPQWLEHCLAALERCDCLALVPGWQNSSGTRAEIKLANAADKPLLHVQGVTA